jgi:hypothetical protein
MKRTFWAALAAALTAILAGGCGNFYHELIPPNGDRITAFAVPGQLSAAVGDNDVTVIVPPGAALESVVPKIRISEGATIIPLTMSYLERAFPGESLFGSAAELTAGGDTASRLIERIRANHNFIRPVLDMPIDFSWPVDFLVVAARGSIRQYRVTVEVDNGEGKFLSFSFEKFHNPDLIVSARGDIDTAAKTVTVEVFYPLENIASYKLIPLFTTNNARVFTDTGGELRSGVSELTFLKPPDSADLSDPNLPYAEQTLPLTLKRTGYGDAAWTLIVRFAEDPDTARSITDFRLDLTRNPLIKDTAVGTITHSGDTGTIEVRAYYAGNRPAEVRPSFVSPGTVSVLNAVQTSGLTPQTYDASLYYKVVSRVGGYTRTYRVTIVLIEASDPRPKITSFAFTQALNPALTANSSAMIDHDGGRIIVEAAYDGAAPPANLIAEFAAEGTVTIPGSGAEEVSGVTAHSFQSAMRYTVTDPLNPNLKRDYRVEVRFVRQTMSAAEISEFRFYRADNPGLLADTDAAVDQGAGTITATLLFDSSAPVTGGWTLAPRWTAQGRIEVNGAVQTNGAGRVFTGPVTYRAVSADGFVRKDYTVTIKIVNTRIYVKQSAAGRANGLTWQDAYRNLPEACADAALFPDAVIREVWIAEGTYTPSGRWNEDDILTISPNTSFVGGFAGNETSLTARNDPLAHRALVTGDLGGGRRAWGLFGRAGGLPAGSAVSFEYLRLAHAGNSVDNGHTLPRGINIPYSDDIITTAVSLTGLAVDDMKGGGAAVHVAGNTTISNCDFTNIDTTEDGALYVRASVYDAAGNIIAAGSVDLDRITVTNSQTTNQGAGINVQARGSPVTLTNSRLENCRGKIPTDTTRDAPYSGGFMIYSGDLRMEDCAFIDCFVPGFFALPAAAAAGRNHNVAHGGWIVLDSSNPAGFLSCRISRCSFTSSGPSPFPAQNYDDNRYGAVHNQAVFIQTYEHRSADLQIDTCTFSGGGNLLTGSRVDRYSELFLQGFFPAVTIRNTIISVSGQPQGHPLYIRSYSDNANVELDGLSITDPNAAAAGNLGVYVDCWPHYTGTPITVRYGNSNCRINGADGAFGGYIRSGGGRSLQIIPY